MDRFMRPVGLSVKPLRCESAITSHLILLGHGLRRNSHEETKAAKKQIRQIVREAKRQGRKFSSQLLTSVLGGS